MVSALNEDRLFPTDPEQRLIARRLYEAIKDRPIISTDTSLSTGSRKTSISRTPPIYSSLLITT